MAAFAGISYLYDFHCRGCFRRDSDVESLGGRKEQLCTFLRNTRVRRCSCTLSYWAWQLALAGPWSFFYPSSTLTQAPFILTEIGLNDASLIDGTFHNQQIRENRRTTHFGDETSNTATTTTYLWPLLSLHFAVCPLRDCLDFTLSRVCSLVSFTVPIFFFRSPYGDWRSEDRLNFFCCFKCSPKDDHSAASSAGGLDESKTSPPFVMEKRAVPHPFWKNSATVVFLALSVGVTWYRTCLSTVQEKLSGQENNRV